MQTGRPFPIFQDKKNILWGQQWKERLDNELFNVTFLIPIITPGYFRSAACRDEFEKFSVREKQLGQNTLILPIYYLEADEIRDASSENADPIAITLSQRNWADWRGLRFKDLQMIDVQQSIASMARTIKDSVSRLEAEIAASEAKPSPPPPTTSLKKTTVDLTKFSPDIPEMRTVVGRKKVIKDRMRSSYYVYTKEFDEIVRAEELVDAEASSKFQAKFEHTKRHLYGIHAEAITQSISELNSRWAGAPQAVIFLVDNSGSLRGEGQMNYLAAWLQILIETLEKVNIPTEVLGFTTKAWKGGRSRDRWLMDGKPPFPGRLNDLRHVVYKAFEQASSEVTANLALLASGRLLKENIDGEALLWAFDRAQSQKSPQTTIVMISDGAPVDDSTLLSNPGDFLEKHLMSTIHWLSLISGLHLYGVGIKFDTSRYYPQGIPKAEAETVGLDILRMLPSWLATVTE
ncbi:MAG: cobalt chelatase [Rhizobium sp.]|nr:cobalt chelatase [Rhizobium sp.]